ncbi:hypothetical protein BDZ97DRAFT_2081830 [Flammula alnicola]|nr:hypothetical protein BDZ97DRAFT_2081830 [Flammula alnicola]
MRTTGTGICDAPIEILDRILDFLHDDQAALCSSSLVSRNWVSVPRYHIFNRTIISEFLTPDRRIKENVHSFLALVQSPYCTILPAIRNVVLNVTRADLIGDVVIELKHSKVLTQIVFIDYSRISESRSLSWIALALPNIHAFSYNAIYAFPADAWRLVTSFPRLQNLAIYTNVHTTFTFPAQIVRPQFLHLRTLRLRLVRSEQFLDGLQSVGGWYSPLETFDLRVLRKSHKGWGPVDALNSFLKANSGSLRHLSLGIQYIDSLVHMDESVCADRLSTTEMPIDLSALPDLSTLFFITHDINSICNSLASLDPSSRLQVLNLHVLCWECGRLNVCDCVPSRLLAKLASIMEENQSLAETTFDLRVSNVFGGPELELVPELFRKWKQRGALTMSSVSFDDEDDVQVGSWSSIRPLVFKR